MPHDMLEQFSTRLLQRLVDIVLQIDLRMEHLANFQLPRHETHDYRFQDRASTAPAYPRE